METMPNSYQDETTVTDIGPRVGGVRDMTIHHRWTVIPAGERKMKQEWKHVDSERTHLFRALRSTEYNTATLPVQIWGRS